MNNYVKIVFMNNYVKSVHKQLCEKYLKKGVYYQEYFHFHAVAQNLKIRRKCFTKIMMFVKNQKQKKMN